MNSPYDSLTPTEAETWAGKPLIRSHIQDCDECTKDKMCKRCEHKTKEDLERR